MDEGKTLSAREAGRKYGIHMAIAGLALAIYAVIFLFFAAPIAENAAEIRRVQSTCTDEIAFTRGAGTRECFYNLNGQLFIFTDAGKRLNCDVFMLCPNMRYDDNALLFDGELTDGVCAVSKNLLAGGVSAIRTENGRRFTVGRRLLAQRGIDGEYAHDGVVILPYCEELLGEKKASFVSFYRGGDAYDGLTQIVYSENMKKNALGAIAWRIAAATACAAALLFVCERFLFGRRRRDYEVMRADGVPYPKLLGVIAGETALKYLLPFLIAYGVWQGVLFCYGACYVLPMLCLFGLCVLLTAGASVYRYMRLRKCGKKRR